MVLYAPLGCSLFDALQVVFEYLLPKLAVLQPEFILEFDAQTEIQKNYLVECLPIALLFSDEDVARVGVAVKHARPEYLVSEHVHDVCNYWFYVNIIYIIFLFLLRQLVYFLPLNPLCHQNLFVMVVHLRNVYIFV